MNITNNKLISSIRQQINGGVAVTGVKISDECLLANIKSGDDIIVPMSEPGLFVVLVTRNKRNPFWMMTYCDPTTTVLELSNISVSELIDIWENKSIDSAIKAYENSLVTDSAKQNK